MNNNHLAEFLSNKFFWFQQYVVKRRASVSDFAMWLNVAQPSLSQWMRGVGREPNLENLVKLASKLGAKGTFEAAGLGELYVSMLADAFKDPALRLLADAWFDGTLNESEREYLLAYARDKSLERRKGSANNRPEGANA